MKMIFAFKVVLVVSVSIFCSAGFIVDLIYCHSKAMSNVFVTRVLNFLTSEYNADKTIELYQALDDPQLDLSSHDDGTGISIIEEILRLPNFMRHIEDSTSKFDFISKLLTNFMKRSSIGPFTCYEIYQSITPFSKSATYMENLLIRNDVITFISSFEDFVQKCKLSKKYEKKIAQFNFVVTRYDEIIGSSDREKLLEISLRDDVLTASEKFLQIATELSMLNVVEFLLKENSNLTMVEAMKTACVRGNHEVLSTFVSRSNSSDAIIGAQLLHKVCLELHTCQGCDSAVNYQKCFNILVNKFPELANETDTEGNVPLHFAAKPKRNESEIVQLLQINGSALTAKNSSGKMPIDEMSLSCLKTFFDTCVKCKGSDSKIEIDYNFLIPHDQRKPKGWELILLGKLKDNLALRPLLTHPIISTFINLKWWNLRHFLAVNFIVVLLFVMSMLMFIYSSRYKWNLMQSISQTVFGLCTCLLIVREVLQLNTLGRKYFIDFKYGLINLSEWILIAGSAFSIINGCNKYVSVPLILIAGFELFTLLATLPVLCAAMYLAILEKVIVTFFKAISFFLIIPLFFALSFNIFYARDPEIDSNEQNDEAHDYNSYQSPWLSIIKVFAMMIGDLGR